MNKFVSFLLSVLAFFGISLNKPVIQQKKAENFVPVLRFMACSDTHIGSASDVKLERIRKAVEFSYATAENDENYNKLDAVLFAGDITNSGTDEQFEAFESTVKSVVKDGTAILAIVAKNHDGYEGRVHEAEWCEKINGIGSDISVNINGFHFIGLSASKKEGIHYDASQKSWLKKQLKEAAAEDPDKPIFVFNHEHAFGTVYGSRLLEGWGTLDFNGILSKYPQAVHISGHSHYPLNDPRSIWQGNYTAIGTGSLHYMEFTVGTDRTVHPDGCYDAAQAWIIEADSSNRIRLRGFDVINSEWLCDYLITDPSNKDTFAYTPYNQKALSSAPEFDGDSKVTLKQENDKCLVSFPAANSTDGKPVFLYRITVYNEKGRKIHSQYLISDYWSSKPAETVSLTIETHSAASVKVVAENAYGMQSAPITAE